MPVAATKRITAAASGGSTRRVSMAGHDASYDCWRGSWGRSWGLNWQNFLSASELSGNLTQRVPSGASGGATRRVSKLWKVLREDGFALLREDGSKILRD